MVPRPLQADKAMISVPEYRVSKSRILTVILNTNDKIEWTRSTRWFHTSSAAWANDTATASANANRHSVTDWKIWELLVIRDPPAIFHGASVC